MLTIGSVPTTNVAISNQSMPAFVQSYSQSQARLMFVTTLGMDNFDCTKMNAHFEKFTACLREGLSQLPWLSNCSTNNKLRILVKAQSSTQSTWPPSPTRLGIWPRDLGLLNKYSLGHCGLFATSRCKLAFTSRHYTLLTAADTTALYYKTPFCVFFF